MLVFDIETGPRPEKELRTILPPFDPASLRGIVTGEFDPSSIKTGHLKDQTKISEKIAAAKSEWEAAKANAANLIAQAEASYWSEVIGKAALSPVTGRVLAIGFYNSESDQYAILGTESSDGEPGILREFWIKYRGCRTSNRAQFGFNIYRFDLPFLVRRSWLLGIYVPETLFTAGGRYFDPLFIDLLSRWQCGGGWNDSIKLDDLARFFGVGGKPDGINGGDFARLWREDREAAIGYLTNDLKITAACATRMGAI